MRFLTALLQRELSGRGEHVRTAERGQDVEDPRAVAGRRSTGLGGYLRVLAVRARSGRVFSGSNVSLTASFSDGVHHRCKAGWATRTLGKRDRGTPVPLSIDALFVGHAL